MNVRFATVLLTVCWLTSGWTASAPSFEGGDQSPVLTECLQTIRAISPNDEKFTAVQEEALWLLIGYRVDAVISHLVRLTEVDPSRPPVPVTGTGGFNDALDLWDEPMQSRPANRVLVLFGLKGMKEIYKFLNTSDHVSNEQITSFAYIARRVYGGEWELFVRWAEEDAPPAARAHYANVIVECRRQDHRPIFLGS